MVFPRKKVKLSCQNPLKGCFTDIQELRQTVASITQKHKRSIISFAIKKTTRQCKPRWGLRVGPMRHNTQNTQSLITVTVIVVIFCSRPREWKWGRGER